MIGQLTRFARIAFPAIVVFLLLIPAAFGGPSIVNGDFEAVTISGFSSSTPGDIPGWTHGGTVGDALIWRKGYSDSGGNITTTGDGTTSEEQFVTLGGGATAIGSADWRTTISGLIAGQSYVLSFKTASETTNVQQSMTVSFLSGSSTGPQVFLSPLSSVNYWHTWGNHSETFVATGTSAVVEFSVSNTFQDEGLDAVSVSLATPTVPEPSSMLLLGTGLLSLAGLVRRKLFS
jgi:hypothetical protein